MKRDHSDSGDPLGKPTEEQVTPSIFLKKTHAHTHSGMQEYLDSAFVFDGISPGACVRLCVRYRPQLSVAYGNFLPPTILHLFPWYHSPPSLWSASRWHSCLASFITVPWWMRRSHLHNALLERETETKAGTKGNTLELWTPIWTLWDTLFLLEVKRPRLFHSSTMYIKIFKLQVGHFVCLSFWYFVPFALTSILWAHGYPCWVCWKTIVEISLWKVKSWWCCRGKFRSVTTTSGLHFNGTMTVGQDYTTIHQIVAEIQFGLKR